MSTCVSMDIAETDVALTAKSITTTIINDKIRFIINSLFFMVGGNCGLPMSTNIFTGNPALC